MALRRDSALTWLPTVELDLDFLSRNGQIRRTAIDDDPYAAPVRLAPRGDPKQLSEGTSHFDMSLSH
jgi:hypothetical protein